MIEFVVDLGSSMQKMIYTKNSPRNKEFAVNDIFKKILLTETLLTASCEFHAIFNNVFKHLN